MMMRKLFIEMMGNGDGEMMMRSERRRRRRERDEEPGGAARGAVGPGRSSRRRRGVVVPILHEDCVEDCRVFAVVREAYVVPRDRPFKSQYTVVAPFLAAAAPSFPRPTPPAPPPAL